VRNHGSELIAEVIEKVIYEFKFAKGLAFFAEFAEGSLKVIGFDGDIGWVSGCLRLLKSRKYAIGIFATLKHVGAVKIDPGAEHDREHGGYVIGRDNGPSVVRVFDTSSHLGGDEGSVG